jgi:carbohydrate kinase (thermoresistant glucokinase family)
MYLIFMGVSGSGKSTYARLIAEAYGWPYIEADDYHPAENVAKMSAGQALNDEDRVEWLNRLCEAITAHGAGPTVATCSALTTFVQDTLSAKLPSAPVYICMDADEAAIRKRMDARDDHYMPSSLLASQLDALTVPISAIRITNDGEISMVYERVRTVIDALLSRSEDQREHQRD